MNSFAIVYVDGKKVGEMRFPGRRSRPRLGMPARRQAHSQLLVVAMPLKGVLLSYTDTNSAREVKGDVERRGLCGDVFLVSTPAAARIADVKIDTSVRKGEIARQRSRWRGLRRDTAYAAARADPGERPRDSSVQGSDVQGRRPQRRARRRHRGNGSRRNSGTSTRPRICLTAHVSLVERQTGSLDA